MRYRVMRKGKQIWIEAQYKDKYRPLRPNGTYYNEKILSIDYNVIGYYPDLWSAKEQIRAWERSLKEIEIQLKAPLEILWESEEK